MLFYFFFNTTSEKNCRATQICKHTQNKTKVYSLYKFSLYSNVQRVKLVIIIRKPIDVPYFCAVRQKILMAKFPYGEVSSRWNVLTPKYPYGEMSNYKKTYGEKYGNLQNWCVSIEGIGYFLPHKDGRKFYIILSRQKSSHVFVILYIFGCESSKI